MGEVYRSGDISRVRRNRVYLFAGAFPLLLAAMFTVIALATAATPMLIPIPHLLIFGALGLGLAYRANKDPVLLRGALEIDDAEVRQGGAVLARRDELIDGVLVPERGATRVRVRRKGLAPPLLFDVKDEGEGRALLRALGFDVTQSVAELKGASEVFTWSLPKQLAVLLGPIFLGFVPATIGLAALLPTVGVAAVPFLVLLLLTYVFGLVFSPTRVRVGVDGIVIRWLDRERFVAFADVTAVKKYKHRSGGKTYAGVELTLRDGSTERIVCGQEGWIEPDVEQMLGRIREAFALHGKSGGELAPSLLARGRRSTREWVTALRGIGAGASSDLRTAPVPPESLLRVVEDAAAAPVMRVGAAVAALAGEPDATARVRVAAGPTASPKLRIALERVADSPEDEAAIADAIAELEASSTAEAR